ncbi:MAG: DUF4143 domain-containing protein, partial [Candidatus Omnitrophota bacterium]
YLLGLENARYLERDPLQGNLFENLVLTEVLKIFWSQGKNAPLYFFRDNIGNEVDLIIERGRRVMAVEIKAGQTVNSDWFKGLDYLKKVMGKSVLSRMLIYGGNENQERTSFNIVSWRDIGYQVGRLIK